MANTDLARLATETGLVLLYHGTFQSPPAEMTRGLHNVRPTVIQAQLESLSRAFTFVDIDRFAQLPDPRGYAAVTFDDGYEAIFEQALPVFEALAIPFTVYLNGATLNGRVFWRDKVRLLESRGWVEEFEAFMRGIEPLPGRRFYRYSKDPSVNSQSVDAELDRFIAERGVVGLLPRYCVETIDALPKHDLISYGNHGHHHYVMSSLSRESQKAEVERTQALIEGMEGRRVSSLFSIPFGDSSDFDASTVAVLRETGYRTVLLSRNRTHTGALRVHGMNAIERFMPRDDANHFLPHPASVNSP